MKKPGNRKLNMVGDELHQIMHRHGFGLELDLSWYSVRIKDNKVQIMPVVSTPHGLDYPLIGFIHPCPSTKRLFFT